MAVSPETGSIKLTHISRVLNELSAIEQEITREQAELLAQRRATMTVWVQTASLKELDAVIDFISRTRF